MIVATARLASRGRITMPVAVRDALRLSAGDCLEFIQAAEGRFEVMVASKDVSSLKGSIRTDRKVSVEDMNAFIKRRASGK